MIAKVKSVAGLFIFFFCVAALAQKQPHISLLSHLTAKDLSGSDQASFSSLWGYAAPDGKEYAIIGSRDSIYFVEVTVPGKPVIRGRFSGHSKSCTNREFKTFSHYCYAVSDVCNEKGTLQIFDLQYLPDSVHRVSDNDSICASSHTLYIEKERLYLNSKSTNVTNSFVPMSIYSLHHPEHPELLADLHPPYFTPGTAAFSAVHDMHARNDTVFLCCGSEGLFIADMRDPVNPVWLQLLPSGSAFNHSCWVTDDGKNLVNTLEEHYSPIMLYDLANLKTKDGPLIDFQSSFGSHVRLGGIAHNAYFKGKLIWTSYYQDGIVLFDWSDPMHVKEIASYDTYPQNDTAAEPYLGMQGCWNVYPYLPSGNIIASDITNGLFVVTLDSVTGIAEIQERYLQTMLLNNPCTNKLRLNIAIPVAAEGIFDVYNTLGQRIVSQRQFLAAGERTVELDVNSLSSGIYILHCSAGNKEQSLRFIKQ